MKINEPFGRESFAESRRKTCRRSYRATHRRVLRGASWNNNDASNTLSSNRNNDQPGNCNNNIGFRCVLVLGGRKAFMPSHRRDDCPGQNPLWSRAKKSLTPVASPWKKQTHGWGMTSVVPGAGNPRGAKAPLLPGKRRGARPWSRRRGITGVLPRWP
ncbi:MAG: SUMF1/EgtB/PvdO family nonheme iron enzyme [Verrucomicrobiaceae bacterium]|nr:SUMF1/EgtB/PvdO family nonheme iron enzyme [Verrucomicrobiaceae bacterium]